MNLRRTLAAVLALLMMLSLPLCASAQVTLDSSFTMEIYSLILARYSDANVMIGSKDINGPYVLYASNGSPLTSAAYHTMDSCGVMFKVGVESGLNVYGLIDSKGMQVVPMSYGDVECISEHWTLGITLEESTVDNYDYKTYDGSAFYLISGYDVFFDGVKVGTLGRNAYRSAYAYGSYLYVYDKQENYTCYDRNMVASAYVADYASNSEYEEKDHQVWHRGSNQQAFCAGCTLTSADVERDVYIVNGRIVDLQGNELGVIDSKYEYVYKFEGDYARVKMNGKYGLIDRAGREIIPCEYDDIPLNDTFFDGGYQGVVKDGKFGYVNLNGEVTCDFVYADSAVRSTYKAPFTSVTDLTGSQIVLSAAVGELPEKYAEVSINSTNGSPLMVVENASEQAGVIDLYGNVLIPLDGTYDDVYDLSVSPDGTMVIGYSGSHTYQVYHFSNSESAEAAAAPAAEQAATDTAAEETSSEAADGTWTCACGSVNTGKFCPECGAAKPEANACPSCGVEIAEGAKFCSECGASLTAE